MIKIEPVVRAQATPTFDELWGYVERQTLCSLGSLVEDEAHVSTAYYVPRALDVSILVLTSPTSRHGRAWSSAGRVAVAIAASDQPWGEPHVGLQGYAEVSQLSQREHEIAFAEYSHRFLRLTEWTPNAHAMLTDLESRFYRLRFAMLRYTDEAKYGEEPVDMRVVR